MGVRSVIRSTAARVYREGQIEADRKTRNYEKTHPEQPIEKHTPFVEKLRSDSFRTNPPQIENNNSPVSISELKQKAIVSTEPEAKAALDELEKNLAKWEIRAVAIEATEPIAALAIAALERLGASFELQGVAVNRPGQIGILAIGALERLGQKPAIKRVLANGATSPEVRKAGEEALNRLSQNTNV